MKFPKSMHAEGWLDHIEKTAPEHMPEALAPHGVKRPVTPKVSPTAAPRIDEVHRVRVETPASRPAATAAAFTAPPATTVIAPKQQSMAPWVLVGGAGAVAIAVAVMVSRNFAPSVDPVAPPPTVVGEAAKPSPEDAQIAAAPTSAGPAAPEVTQAPAEPPVAAATPMPAPAEPPRVVAAAPAPKAEAPKPTPEPKSAPVTKTLTPQPEVLAQASPPPVALRDPVQPATPLVTPPATAQPTVPPVTTPEQATPTPVVPPVAQATPQPQPQAADPEDTGITIKVRTALASDATLAAVPIAVTTDHGVVKLEGQAPDPQARERATVVAAATQGVKAVDNRLTLPPVAKLQQLEPQQVARAPETN